MKFVLRGVELEDNRKISRQLYINQKPVYNLDMRWQKKYIIALPILVIGLILALGVNQAMSKSVIKTLRLPSPKTSGAVSLEESIDLRRSERSYKANDLSLLQLSQLLWAMQGITDTDWGLRAAPSAGAIYPLEIYILKATGIFHYVPKDNKLEQISLEDRRSALAQAALGQNFINEAPATFVIAANFQKVRQKYGGRTERYVYMEAGHAAENLHLQAVAMGLGSVAVGAFWDDIAKKVCELPDNLHPVYLIPVGYVAE